MSAILGLWLAQPRWATEDLAHLERTLTAEIVAIGCCFVTFGVFHCRILTGALSLFIGAMSALLRLTNRPTNADLPRSPCQCLAPTLNVNINLLPSSAS